jgi:hypothetical protein
MARIIENYGDLTEAIADWLNRTDAGLVDRIPTFIYLAERAIFRRYRNPNNEKTVTYNMKTDPDPGVEGELILDNKIQLQTDYLETLTLQVNGRPMTRVSLTKIQAALWGGSQANTQVGSPDEFARERSNLLFSPFPDGDTLVKHIYYCDLTGTMTTPESDNDVLRTAPDLYLYGALLQAQPYLKPTDDEKELIMMWKGLFDEAFSMVEFQRDEDERSGSNVEIQSAFGAGVHNLTRSR